MKISTGALYALAAYSAWGLFPLYWRFLRQVPALEILSHRVIWSFIFYLILLRLVSQKSLIGIIRTARVVGFKKVALAAALISVNWGLYVWAVNADHALETSLGYFINPLVNVALGVVFLGERLKTKNKIALVVAGIGVLILSLSSASGFPWIAITLALTFGFYALIRKTLPYETLTGSTLETLLLVGPAFLFLLLNDTQAVTESYDLQIWILLIVGGAVTGLPLLFFSEASKRLPLSVLGYFQYIAPTLQFLCAVLVFKEPFTKVHLFSFALIWTAIAINLIKLPKT